MPENRLPPGWQHLESIPGVLPEPLFSVMEFFQVCRSIEVFGIRIPGYSKNLWICLFSADIGSVRSRLFYTFYLQVQRGVSGILACLVGLKSAQFDICSGRLCNERLNECMISPERVIWPVG